MRWETLSPSEDHQALRNAVTQRVLFILIALFGAGLLMLRPVPTLESSNDTGRYIYAYQKQCAGQTGPFGEGNVSWHAFRVLTGPLCIYADERAFMFFIALLIPVIFVLFGGWEKPYLIWALAGTFNFFSFELATNALRQATGLLVLVASMWMLVRGRWVASVFAAIAGAALHISVAAYSPFVVGLLLYSAARSLGRRGRVVVIAIFSAMVIFVTSIFGAATKAFLDTRQLWYQEGSSLAFLGFVQLPSLYVYSVRCIATRGRASSWEHLFFAYSMLLSAAVLLFFPAILYRLALTNALVQFYLASIQGNSTPRQGLWMFFGLVLHLLAFFLLSDYARGVLGF
jgi:hypothetical protein